MNLQARHWKKTPGLATVYKFAQLNGFFNHRSWEQLVEKTAGVTRMRRLGNFVLPMHFSKESASSFVRARLLDDTDMTLTHWQRKPGLDAVFYFAKKNRFFGKKNWGNFVVSLTRPRKVSGP